MRNFQLLAAGLDVSVLMHQIQTNSWLWNEHKLRTTHQGSVHSEVDDIWIRFNDVAEFEKTGNASSIIDQHESIWYPAASYLLAARPILYDLARKFEAERIGRVMITRLKPGAKIAPHVDGGDHAKYYSRYHVVLQGFPGSVFRAGDEQVQMLSGQVWWFDNQQEHECVNNSADDRVHMIVDLKLAC